MTIEVEVSRPHYHPDKDNGYTKKRDLSVPPHWVANERVEKDGVSYAVVMPPREKELYEDRQELHVHFPEYLPVVINDQQYWMKVKVQPGEYFEPKIHIDDVEAKEFNINPGDKGICLIESN